MEKFRDRFFFIILLAVWGGLLLWNLVSPSQTFSESENRTLASFPTFTWSTFVDGTYMDSINTYLNDHFAGRSAWVTGQTVTQYAQGKRVINGVYIGRHAMFAQLPLPDNDIVQANVQGINDFTEQMGLPAYVMLVPSAAAVQPEGLPWLAESWDQAAFIRETNALFGPQVTALDVASTLAEHRDEYIYYRTDHHWTTYGAFLAYRDYCAARGLPVPSLGAYDPVILSDNFLGTLHSKTGYPFMQPDVMELYQQGEATGYMLNDGNTVQEFDSPYFDDFLGKKDKYSYFFGQLELYATIYTNAPTDKKLLVIKDSYSHCMMPMLLNEYSEIRMVDMRIFDPQTDYDNFVAEAANYDEILFLYSVEVFSNGLSTTGKLRNY